MKACPRSPGGLALAALCLAGAAWAQDVERQFPFPAATVQATLERLGAFTGSRLPSLDGFIEADNPQQAKLEHPYYEFKIEVTPEGEARSTVRVRAAVSGWYQDPDGARSGYKSVRSNGRLEKDLLDRLEAALNAPVRKAPMTAGEIAAIQKQAVEARGRITALEAQLRQLAEPTAPPQGRYVAVGQGGARVCRSRDESSALFEAMREDQFEVLDRQGAWLQVKLEGGHTGWVRSERVAPVTAWAELPAPGTRKAWDSGFVLQRETVATFSGEWPQLQGKDVLYAWARPDESVLDVTPDAKLRFAMNLFQRRYRQALHAPETGAAGMVIIFMDPAGGVAAASFADIRNLADGKLTETAFLARCSLDPRSRFFPPRTRRTAGERPADALPHSR